MGKSLNFEDLYVANVEKVDKKNDKGSQTLYKAKLAKVGDTHPVITIVSDTPLELPQGEKGVIVNVKMAQTTLNDASKETQKKK